MSKLPTISELYENSEITERKDQLNYLLNQQPPKSWIKRNKFANNSLYIPIDRAEWLVKRIFKHYKVEVREVKQLFNGVTCTVRLHYQHPITGEWSYHDGVGAAQIQTKKGSSPADLANINNNAVQLVVPIAKAEAFKNATKQFGRLFGSDLNRESQTNYDDFLIFGDKHPNWDAAVEAVKSGNYTIEQVQSKYQMDEETLKIFTDATKI